MKLHTVAKFGGILSVILFLVGVAMYCFAKLSEAGEGRNMDLMTLVPSDCVGVLETDNLDYFYNEFPQTSYAAELNTLRNAGSIHSILNDIKEFSNVGSHRLGNQMNHVMVSFHSEIDVHDVVAYFKMGKDSKRLLSELIRSKEGVKLEPKRETYRGENIDIYPLGHTQFVAVYNGKGFLAVSYQKRLIERVIDARKDDTSLRNDANFSSIQRTKTANYMTFYAKSLALPVLDEEKTHCWNTFDVHLNSDVFYLSGGVFGPQTCMQKVCNKLDEVQLVDKEDFLMVSGKNKVDSCISEAIIAPNHSLFDECVSNLSREASYIMVADLAQLNGTENYLKDNVPDFVQRHLNLFSPFILSVQITKLEDRLSHIFVFTYKN